MPEIETKLFKEEVNSNNPQQKILDESTMSRIEPGSSEGFFAANKWFLILFGIATVVIAVLAYMVFFNTSGTTAQQAAVKITIEAPADAPSGSEVVYRIKIENQDKKTLGAGELELVYPEGASYLSSTPPRNNGQAELFPVPSLVSGQNAVVFVKLKLGGSIGVEQNLSARYRYTLSGISTKFEVFQDSKIALSQSGLKLSIDGPVNAGMDQLVVYNITYQNNSKSVIKQARINLTLPEGFSLQKSEPARSSKDLVWDIGDLSVDQSGKIVLTGTFTNGNQKESKQFNAELQVFGSGGSYLTQSKADFSTVLDSSPLSVRVSRDGSNQGGIVNPGDKIVFKVDYSNSSNVAVHGVNVQVSLDGKAFDLASLASQGGQVTDNTINWNASGVSGLENLLPNQSGTLKFSVDVKNPPVKDNSKNILLKVNSKIFTDNTGVSFPGSALTFKIQTAAKLSVTGKYASGASPLQVGSETFYTVTLAVRNTTNDIKDLVVTAFLPLGAGSFDTSSLPSREASAVRFDPGTGKLTWNAGLVPAFTGSFSPARTLEFRVRVKPEASQKNRTIQLIKNIGAIGSDSFTSSEVNIGTEDLSTADIDENGVVQ